MIFSQIIGYSMRAIPVPPGTDPKVFRGGEQIACRVSITTCFDLKGLIPRWLVNWVAGKAPITWAVNLQKAVDKGLGSGACLSPLSNGASVPPELVMLPAPVAATAAVSANIAAGGHAASSSPSAPLIEFCGSRLVSAQDFADSSSCDQFSVDEMMRDGWEQLTDEPTVKVRSP